MKRLQKTFAIILAVILICSQSYVSMAADYTSKEVSKTTKESDVGIMPASTAHTQAEAIAWVKSQVGKSLDMDGAYGAQCVDLILAYYDYLGVPRSSGNGSDYTWNTLPNGWQRIQGAVPQPGDILVYTGGYGHVAIFESTYSTYHQNFNSHSYVERVTYAYNGLSNPYWGVIRPNFSNNWYDTLTPVNIGDEVYAAIVKREGWKPLGVVDGNVELVDENKDDTAKWRFVRQNDGSYVIYNCKNNLVLDVQEAEDKDGANICVFNYKGAPNQKWFIYGRWNGEYVLRPQMSKRVLDVAGGLNEIGTNIQIWPYNNGGAQQFSIYEFPKVGASKLSVKIGDSASNTKFSWTEASDAKKYSLRIQKGTPGNMVSYKDVWGMKELSYDIVLPAGYYEAYVDSSNDYSYLASNVVKFTVGQNYAISKCSLVLNSKTYEYTGKAIKPDFIVKNGDETLVENRDYTVLYTNNINVGTATMTVKGMGKYSGELSGKFEIKSSSKMNFKDVHNTDWYYNSVAYVYENGLMGGMTPDTFGPNVSLTRAQFATILHQVAGQPEINYSAKFPDVPNGQWYTKGVLWANSIGVVGGYNNGTFGPNDKITREQMALMMYNYARYKGYDVSKKTDISSFADVSKVSSYAQEAMKWAVGNQIIGGKSGNKLDPQGKATRAECATIIMKFVEQYEK